MVSLKGALGNRKGWPSVLSVFHFKGKQQEILSFSSSSSNYAMDARIQFFSWTIVLEIIKWNIWTLMYSGKRVERTHCTCWAHYWLGKCLACIVFVIKFQIMLGLITKQRRLISMIKASFLAENEAIMLCCIHLNFWVLQFRFNFLSHQILSTEHN